MYVRSMHVPTILCCTFISTVGPGRIPTSVRTYMYNACVALQSNGSLSLPAKSTRGRISSCRYSSVNKRGAAYWLHLRILFTLSLRRCAPLLSVSSSKLFGAASKGYVPPGKTAVRPGPWAEDLTPFTSKSQPTLAQGTLELLLHNARNSISKFSCRFQLTHAHAPAGSSIPKSYPLPSACPASANAPLNHTST